MIDPQKILSWIQIVFYATATLGVIISWRTFLANQKVRRGEWLKSLFEKFYENESFKEVRKWIESGEVDKKINLDEISVTQNEEKLADYLNFFEFIATLQSDGQLKSTDVSNLFDHYLKKIRKSKVCVNWIDRDDYGFEKLRILLQKIK